MAMAHSRDDAPGSVPLTLLPETLRPDPSRTVIRPFLPSDPDAFALAHCPRARRIVERVLALDPAAFRKQLRRTWESLDARHRDVRQTLLRRFDEVRDFVSEPERLGEDQRLLIGAYLSAEYSFEAAALFNPSIVPHPDEPGGKEGALRFLLSLRGIGEGHMSSVTFRTGTWAADGSVTVDPPCDNAMPPIVGQERKEDGAVELDCNGSRDVSETVLFPVVESQSRGIEDLRLTRLSHPGAPATYAGTYTALGSKGVRQEILFTDDFRRFTMRPVKGSLAGAKGLALFPRQIGGRFLALGRQDNESLWLVESDDLVSWSDGRKLLAPAAPWEIVQIGNCGSPIEIEEGWLVLTHGVGVVRNYCMGAALLDRDDPSRVLGRLAQPLLEPGGDDRDGYVPNVVYSCGALVRGRTLLLPYGIADEFTRFATLSLDDLVGAMR